MDQTAANDDEYYNSKEFSCPLQNNCSSSHFNNLQVQTKNQTSDKEIWQKGGKKWVIEVKGLELAGITPEVVSDNII